MNKEVMVNLSEAEKNRSRIKNTEVDKGRGVMRKRRYARPIKSCLTSKVKPL